MKKIIIILLVILLCGCEKDSKNVLITNSYYNIALPYKEGVSNNYIINNLSSYDVDHVESSLMHISSLYFSNSNSFYQDGQYLDNEFLKDVLSKDKLNNYDLMTIDGVTINPYYVTGISEQNYLDSKGDLKGISLGVILNPYQAYENSYGTILYKKVNDDEILKIGNEVSIKLLKEIRNIDELANTKVLVGLYLQESPNSNSTGGYKKYGISDNNSIFFEDYIEDDYYIISDYVMQNNKDVYNYYLSLEKILKNNLEKLYLTGNCSYKNGILDSTFININSSNLSNSEVLLITQLIENNLNIDDVLIHINENDFVKAIVKRDKSGKINTYILEGK